MSHDEQQLPGTRLLATYARTLDATLDTSSSLASLFDQHDELSKYREAFHLARARPHVVEDKCAEEAEAEEAEEEEAVYLCGNSLGLQPRRTQAYLSTELRKWARCGVEGHFLGARPWASVDELVTGLSARLVGAASAEEVAVMNSLSVNLHLLMVAFYRPQAGGRRKVLMEKQAFCSDHHVVRSQVALHGLEVDDAVVQLEPRDGEYWLRTEDIEAAIAEHADDLALVLLPGVQFYTGQAFEMGRIAAAAHAAGSMVGFDLAHAVGNIELRLHEWDVDFACWCSYKYLNSGPGSIAGAFVHSKHADKNIKELPRLCGWWGQELQDRFAMQSEWKMKPGAQSFQMSNPAVLPTICLLASLEVFDEAGGMPALRRKSVLLTAYLEYLLREEIDDSRLTIITPTDPEQRGCQLSLLLGQAVRPVHTQLQEAGVICDVREPNVMRIAPAPLYNSFADVRRFVTLLGEAMASCSE